MSDLAAKYPPMSFDGIVFPFVECSVKGSLKHHVHEYMHAPGGEIEEMKRRLYEIDIECDFHDVFVTYPGLYPEKLNQLRTKFESGESKPLSIPQIGTIQAKAIEWEQRLMARILSGEKVRFKFLEDSKDAHIALTSNVTSTPALAPLAVELLEEADAAGLTDIFSGVAGLVDSITGIGEQVALIGDRLDSKVQSLTDALNRLDRQVNAINDPSHWAVVAALHELAVATIRLHRDTLRKAIEIVEWHVKVAMTISQVSQEIYGTTLKAVELLQINDLDDALLIPPGTRIRYYAAA